MSSDSVSNIRGLRMIVPRPSVCYLTAHLLFFFLIAAGGGESSHSYSSQLRFKGSELAFVCFKRGCLLTWKKMSAIHALFCLAFLQYTSTAKHTMPCKPCCDLWLALWCEASWQGLSHEHLLLKSYLGHFSVTAGIWYVFPFSVTVCWYYISLIQCLWWYKPCRKCTSINRWGLLLFSRVRRLFVAGCRVTINGNIVINASLKENFKKSGMETL